MYCRNCGKKISDYAEYCTQCGAKQKITFPDDKPKGKKWLLIILLVLVLIAAAVAAIFVIKGRKKKDEPEQEITIPVTEEASKGESGQDPDRTTEDAEQEEFSIGSVYELKEENIAHDDENDFDYVNNMVIIFFTDDATEGEIENLIASVGGTVAGSIPALNQYQVEVEAQSLAALMDICEYLETQDIVESASIDVAVQLSSDEVPNDPWKKSFFFFKEGWNENDPGGSNWWQEAINAPSAWDHNDEFSEIRIGVVDDGIDSGHEDLSNVVWSVSSNNNSEEHGTHVCGIIGAEANNDKGIAGVVWNARIYTKDWSLTDAQANSGSYNGWNTTTEILSAVSDLIISRKTKVVNLSAGQTGSLDGTTRTNAAVNAQGKNASAYLKKLLEKGYDFVIVQSAGNGNKSQTSVNAIYNGIFCSINENNCETSDTVSAEDIIGRIIVVGAAEKVKKNEYRQTTWSNAGSRVDICAPGKDIYSTVPGGYKNMSGTSMAAPIVTGVASLVWSVDTGLTGAEVKDIVCAGENTRFDVADNTSSDHPLHNTYRMVNAQLAVEAAVESKEEREDREREEIGKKDREADPIEYDGKVDKPEEVVLKLFADLKNGDYAGAVSCMDPDTEDLVNYWGGLASSAVEYLTGELLSWGDMASAAGGANIDVIECYSYNKVYDKEANLLAPLLVLIPGIKEKYCTEADVYVKLRYEVFGQYYIEEQSFHVKKYEDAGWRIVISLF